MSSFVKTRKYNINHNNITYISYEKLAGGLATLHFIGGDKIDVKIKEEEKVIKESDFECTEELINILRGRLDDIVTTLAEKA